LYRNWKRLFPVGEGKREGVKRGQEKGVSINLEGLDFLGNRDKSSSCRHTKRKEEGN
jgi:hypothetical protein